MTIDASERSAILKSEIKELGDDPKISERKHLHKYFFNIIGWTGILYFVFSGRI